MKKLNTKTWKQYGFEFISIFIAVVSAFALNNWSEYRRDYNSENKILIEIANGLDKDLEDIKVNMGGHKEGISACKYFRNAIAGKETRADSLFYYYSKLTRDFVCIQNIAGYQTLKSKGLELLRNDSLRYDIISLYEYDYSTLRKFEEEYAEMQFEKNYSRDINEVLAANLQVNDDGLIMGFDLPLKIEQQQKNKLLLYLLKIQSNRMFILQFYSEIEKKINGVTTQINEEIGVAE